MVYVRLEALGVIRRHRGKGIFIADPRVWAAAIGGRFRPTGIHTAQSPVVSSSIRAANPR